ncbi:serine hydrolase domain-containing protein [Glaciecola sp. MF2-115]|uniref:serine hydrolase domain-containing protein n=1 Tax=Glaciecola sp. MF2-115 TaxID=3384827 RepID=UPI00399F1F5B
MDAFKQINLITLIVTFWVIVFSAPVVSNEINSNLAKKSANANRSFSETIGDEGPGCSIAAYHKGNIIFQGQYGHGHLGLMTPITKDSVFDLASNSKQFTAASILILQHQGKLKIEDDIRKYLPEIPNYGKVITIRHLLNHTSGIRDYINLMTLSNHHIDDVTTQKDAMFFMKIQKALDFEPGEKYSYSNSGYLLAAEIVERVSGVPLKEFAKQHIFDELEMQVTTYVNSHKKVIKNRVEAYALEDGMFVKDVSYWEQYGDGAVFSTTEDLIKWDSIFYSEDYRWLKEQLYKKGTLNNGEEIPYALGLAHENYKGLEVILHGGSWGGYRSQFVRNHEHHFSAVALCNYAHSNPTNLTYKLFDIFLADFLTPEEDSPSSDATPSQEEESELTLELIELTSDLIEHYSGRYQFTDYPSYSLEVLVEEESGHNKLYLNIVDAKRVQVWPTQENALVDKNNRRVLWFNPDGTISYDNVAWGLTFLVKKLNALSVPLPDLNALTGEYFSVELDKKLDIKLIDKQLIAFDKRDNQTVLFHIDLETLLADQGLGLLKVLRDKSDDITGLSLDTNRAKGIVFEKMN